jgi:hypothetical protein
MKRMLLVLTLIMGLFGFTEAIAQEIPTQLLRDDCANDGVFCVGVLTAMTYAASSSITKEKYRACPTNISLEGIGKTFVNFVDTAPQGLVRENDALFTLHIALVTAFPCS